MVIDVSEERVASIVNCEVESSRFLRNLLTMYQTKSYIFWDKNPCNAEPFITAVRILILLVKDKVIPVTGHGGP
jgi:hypothetical protein